MHVLFWNGFCLQATPKIVYAFTLGHHSRSSFQVWKMLAKHDSIEVKESPGKGRGIFCIKSIKEGQKILSESPTVIGPKQTSPFVCVDCFDYIDEQTGKNR